VSSSIDGDDNLFAKAAVRNTINYSRHESFLENTSVRGLFGAFRRTVRDTSVCVVQKLYKSQNSTADFQDQAQIVPLWKPEGAGFGKIQF
jgi:hypothetical protein